MRVLFYSLAISMLLAGCSTSSQMVRNRGFVIAQQAPVSTATDQIEARSPAAQTLSTPISLQVPTSHTFAGKRTNAHTGKPPRRLATVMRTAAHHIPNILRVASYAHVYTATKAVLQGKRILDNPGCTCVGLVVLAVALIIGITLLWNAIFATDLTFTGMVIVGLIVVGIICLVGLSMD